MSFLDSIDEMILDMNGEIEKIRRARVDKNYHARYVTEKISNIVMEQSKINPEEPARSLGTGLSKISESIVESFERLDKIESNVLVTINAYTKIKNKFIEYQKEETQDISSESSPADNNDNSKAKNRREKPENKLKNRRKKTQGVSKKPTEKALPKK